MAPHNKQHNLGSAGDHAADTLANLNALISDANLDDSSASRPPQTHAASHTDGTDNIQPASSTQSGLLTAAAQLIGGVKKFVENFIIQNTSPGIEFDDTNAAADQRLVRINANDGEFELVFVSDDELLQNQVFRISRSGLSASLWEINPDVKLNGKLTGGRAGINDETAAPYTLVANDDNGSLVRISDTLTIPTGLPVGFNCTVHNTSGTKESLDTTGLTVEGADAAANISAGGVVTLVITATDTVLLSGNMEA